MMHGGGRMGGNPGLRPPPAYPGYGGHSNSPNAGPVGVTGSPKLGYPRGHSMMSTPPHGGPMNMGGTLPPGAPPMGGMQHPSQASPSMKPQPVYSEQEKEDRIRFQIELEFVQCLGNPNYLNFLAQRDYFRDPCFVNYLKYLQYWKDPKYVKFIKFPVCLHFLDLLQHESFRKEIINTPCAKFLDDQVILGWQHYSRKRIKLIENSAGGATVQMNGQDPSTNPTSSSVQSSNSTTTVTTT